MTSDGRGAVSIRFLAVLVPIALLAAAGPAFAKSVSPTLLYQTPTADVLPQGALAVSADMTFPLVNTPQNVNYPEADLNVRFSPFQRLDFALTAYTFVDYALDLKYQVLSGGSDRPSIAVGVYDIGLSSYISPVGHDTAHTWPDWKYNKYLPRYGRLPERFSAFAVASIPVTKYARLHVGLGNGRFIGYDINSKYFNVDYLFNEYDKWAFGFIGGAEVYLNDYVTLAVEASGRDLNTGVKFNYEAFTATVAWDKMEGLLFSEGDARFGRFEVGLSYRFEHLTGAPAPAPRVEPVYQPPTEPTPPESVEVPPPPPVSEPPKLEPIWFDWDKWDIRPEAAATLRSNAEVLLAHPEMKVVVIGTASEEGTLEHNIPLSGRRAQAAYEYLKSLGVPAEQMRPLAEGESPGTPLPPHRSVYFQVQVEK
jgi:hypothetical protein